MSRNNKTLIIDHTERHGPAEVARDMFFKSIVDQGGEVRSINYWTEAGEDDCILIGKTEDRLVRQLLEWNQVEYVNRPEGILFQWCNNGDGEILVIAGTDENGLMYALFEIFDRVNSDGLEFRKRIDNYMEYPDNKIRSVSRFVMSRRDDEWFYSEEFWNYYFVRLAKYRFNRFVLIVGFDTPYLSPPYPFFIDVPGYPNVSVPSLEDSRRQKNLNQLRRIGQLCKRYGLEFSFATWQQTPWTKNQTVMVKGLENDEEILGDYCAVGLRELLIQCPEIEVVQLRVNHEAGVGTQVTAETFWKKIIASVSQSGRKVRLDLRAKGLTDSLIQFTLEQGLHLSIPTKYWCEHLALPYHLSKMREEELERLENYNHSRRYSYADLLRKPHFYDIIYRLWNYGSNTIFLWGDPDFCRRFSYSLDYGQSIGFEITAPLSLKGGQASFEDEPWPLFDDKTLIHYKWEDERFWAFYLFFGRLTYSSQTPDAVWKREFQAHFGEAASLMETAYRSAGKILPLITSYHMPVHPSLSYWPEVCTGAALFKRHNFNRDYNVTFQDTEPSDSGLFYGISEYVQDVLDDKVAYKYTPRQVRNWLSRFAADVRNAIEQAESMKCSGRNSEFRTTKIDLLTQADLAEYHTTKIMAALELSFYQKTTDTEYLQRAYKYAILSLEFWKTLSDRGSVYHHNLQFGVGGVGRSMHWKDRLSELEKDVEEIKFLIEENGLGVSDEVYDVPSYAWECGSDSLTSVESDVPEYWEPGKDLEIHIKIGELSRFHREPNLHYRHMNQLEGGFVVTDMKKIDGGYSGVIEGKYISKDWDLLVYFSWTDSENNVVIYPGIYHPKSLAPYHIVKIK